MKFKDYYTVLGVVPKAEDLVIRAAYRALIQRYHPDKYQGSQKEAEERTRELNEAYEVLSNPKKRAEFDQQRSKFTERTSEYHANNAEEEVESELPEIEKKWKFALEYYPDLADLEARLRKISYRLSLGLKILLIESKEFEQRETLAQNLEQQFLESYFGTNKNIINFATRLILQGEREAAKELNKAVALLGTSANSELIINKVRQKYFPEEIAKEKELKRAKEEEVLKAKKEEDEKKRRNEKLQRSRQDRQIYLNIFIAIVIFITTMTILIIFQ